MRASKKPTEYYDVARSNDPRLAELVQAWDSSSALEKTLSDGSFAILGWADDRGIGLNHGRKGAAEGPDAIRSAFYRLTLGSNCEIENTSENISEETNKKTRIIDLGNLEPHDEIRTCHEKAAQMVTQVVKTGSIPLCLGGGNDYAYADVLGLSRALDPKRRVGVINIDAHFDVRDLEDGLSSGTPYYRLLDGDSPVIQGKDFVEFGIQPQRNSSHHYHYVMEKGASVISLQEIKEKGVEKSFLHCLQGLQKKCDAIVVSLDIDSVQQSDAPGCSAPSPNGLTANDIEIIAHLSGKQEKTKLFSIYEVSPPFDRDQQTARLAASAMWWFIRGVGKRSFI